MKYLYQKIKAASIQYVLVISVIIIIVVSAFISLIYLQKKITLKGELYKETIHHTNLAFGYLNQANISYDSPTELFFSDYDFEETILERKHWGIFDLITVQATLRNETFQKIALTGSRDTTRQALYLQDNNQPLVLVGKTHIKGTVSLPKKGVKRGSIAGTSYYGNELIYGQTQSGSTSLPAINTIRFLKSFIKDKPFDSSLELALEDGLKKRQSFNEPTLIHNSAGSIALRNISLQGNIIITSDVSITVHASAVLEHVILMAPEITVKSNVEGIFQALATEKIVVEKNTSLEYPSALIVLDKNTSVKNQENAPKLLIENDVQLKGLMVYETEKKEFDYNVQVYIGEKSTITGEVYCKKNLELKGKVLGSVYAGNFIAKEFGGVYVNHIYNGHIDASLLPDAFSGLPMNSGTISIAKWVY